MEESQEEQIKAELRADLNWIKLDCDNYDINYDSHLIRIINALRDNWEDAEELITENMTEPMARWLMEKANYSSIAIFNYLCITDSWDLPRSDWAIENYVPAYKEFDLPLFTTLIERLDLDDAPLADALEMIGIIYVYHDINVTTGIELLKLSYYLRPEISPYRFFDASIFGNSNSLGGYMSQGIQISWNQSSLDYTETLGSASALEVILTWKKIDKALNIQRVY